MILPRRISEIGFWAAATSLYALPLLAAILVNADFTALANESIAYRYFAVDRIQGGERGNIWLPQGHLTTTIQHIVGGVVNAVDAVSGLSFRGRLGLFGHLTLATYAAIAAGLFALAARDRRLTWGQRSLIALIVLVPTYAAGIVGFHIHLLPDYQALSTLLLGWSSYLIFSSRSSSQVYTHLAMALRRGAFIGLLIANKITLAPAGMLIALATAFAGEEKRGIKRTSLYLAGIMVGTVAVTIFVISAFYLFRVRAIVEMAPRWWKFVGDPGTEPNFWVNIALFTREYFAYGAIFFLIALIAFLSSLLAKWSSDHFFILVGSLATLAACIVFVQSRPAHSTFFDVFVLLIFASSVLIGTLPENGRWRALPAIAIAAWLIAVVTTFPARQALLMLQQSRDMGNERWDFFESTRRMSAGARVLVVIPDNEYAHGGVHELLLKGAAAFPTWGVDEAGYRIVGRYSAGLRFYHEYAPSDLQKVVQDARTVVWFDRFGLPPLKERYPALNALVNRQGVVCQTGVFTDFGRPSNAWWRCSKRP